MNLEDEAEAQAPIFSEDLKNYYTKEEKPTNNNEDDEEMDLDEKGENNIKNLPDHFDDVSDEEQDDFTIHPTDSLIVCGTAQDDFSNLEIYIYDENTLDLFVIMI